MILPELRLFESSKSARMAFGRSISRIHIRLLPIAFYIPAFFGGASELLEYFVPWKHLVFTPVAVPWISWRPLWWQDPFILAYIFAALTAPFYYRYIVSKFRRELRFELNRQGRPICVECGYDLGGVPGRSCCSECGAPFPPNIPPEFKRDVQFVSFRDAMRAAWRKESQPPPSKPLMVVLAFGFLLTLLQLTPVWRESWRWVFLVPAFALVVVTIREWKSLGREKSKRE